MKRNDPLSTRIPARIFRLAEQHQLGQLRSKHRRIFIYLQLIGVLILGAGIIDTLIQSIQIRNDDVQIYAQDRVWAAQHLTNCPSCSAAQKAQLSLEKFDLLESDLRNLDIDKYSIQENVGYSILPFIYLLFTYLEMKQNLYVCDDGLLNIIVGRPANALTWAEISEMSWFLGIVKQVSSSETEQKRKSEIRIWKMSKARRISKLLDEQVTPRLLIGARMRYAWDGMVEFGSVTVSRRGIERTMRPSRTSKKQTLVAWESLEDIRFARGAIFLKSGGTWQRWTGGFWAQLSENKPVLNPTCCVALVKEILELGAWKV